MAIFKYKHSDGTIVEMPVISNIYTDYVISEEVAQDPQIILTPSSTNTTLAGGAYESITASIDLLNTTPTYTYDIDNRSKTITFNSTEWRNAHGDKFPKGIEISIPSSRWLNKTNDVSSPPATLTISDKTDTVPVPAGYYSSDFEIKLSDTAKGQIVSNNILYNTTIMGVTGTNTNNRNTALTIVTNPTSSNKSGAAAAQILENYQAWVNGSKISGSIHNYGNIKDQTQIKPSNYATTYYSTGYYIGGNTSNGEQGKVNIATGAITLTANSPNGTPYTYSDWGNVFPTSITVAVPDTGIDTSSATAYSTLYNNREKIPKNYVVYGSGSGSSVTGTMELYTHTSATTSNLTSQGATRTIEAGYHDGKETIKVQLPANTMTKTFTDSSYSSVSRSAGYYNAGTISINSGNLTASNIKKDITILGVKGTYEGTTYTELTGSTSLSPSSFTYDESGMSPFYGYAVAGSTSKRVHDYTLKIYSNSKTITVNDTYTLFGSSANWNAIPTQITVEVPDDITHGSIANTSLYYTLTLDNVLTFSGTGDIPDDFISNYLSSYTSYIHNIDMSFAFISSIGDFAFNGCSYVRFLSFSPFTKTIGIYAFQNINSALRTFNTALRLVVMPVSLIDMDAYIFYGCWIRNLWFPGRPLTSWPQYGLKVGNDGKIYDLRYAWSSSQHSNDMGADPVYSPKFDANFGNITSLT